MKTNKHNMPIILKGHHWPPYLQCIYVQIQVLQYKGKRDIIENIPTPWKPQIRFYRQTQQLFYNSYKSDRCCFSESKVFCDEKKLQAFSIQGLKNLFNI